MRAAVAFLGLLLCVLGLADEVRFIPLSSLLGTPATRVNDVSDSGFVIGAVNSLRFRAHLPTGTVVILQPYPNTLSGEVCAVSEHGVVVGEVIRGNFGRACVWDRQGAPRLLLEGQLPDFNSMATDITPDSVAIAGWVATAPSERLRVFRFDEAGVSLYGDPRGSTGTQRAYTISGDGQTLGGTAMMPHPTRQGQLGGGGLPLIVERGVLWRTNGTIQTLDGINNGFSTEVRALSRDGRVAVGASEVGGLPDFLSVPVLWRDRNVQLLDSRGGTARGVDASGKRVAGAVRVGSESQAFLWTAARGFEFIAQRFRSAIPSGWRLTNAAAISPNGRYIVGMGVNPDGVPDGWVLILHWRAGDVDESGCVDDTDFVRVVVRLGQTGIGIAEDLNDDGVVDDNDLVIVLLHFGQGC